MGEDLNRQRQKVKAVPNKPPGLLGNRGGGRLETGTDSVYKATFKASVDLQNGQEAETPSVWVQYQVGVHRPAPKKQREQPSA